MGKSILVQRAVWVIPVLFFFLLAGWAVTSPVGSSPDDDYHLASIWCSNGNQTGRCINIVSPQAKAVPALVGAGQKCYAFKPKISAECQEGTPKEGFVVVERVNDVRHLYPTSYYKVMSVFVGENIELSVVTMRLFNAFLASLMLWLVLLLTPRGVKTAYLLAASVVLVPLGFFIIPSVNPSSWTIVGLAAYWAFALSLMHEPKLTTKRGILTVCATILAAGMAISSRPDAMIYLVITTLVVFTYTGLNKVRQNWLPAVMLIVISLFAAYSYTTVTAPGAEQVMGKTARGLGLLIMNSLNLPQLYQGVVGGWNLGWNDTMMPFIVPCVGMLAIGFVVYHGLLVWNTRKVMATSLAFLAMVAVPLAFYQIEGLRVGQVVQSRYVIPLLFLFLASISLGKTVHDKRLLPTPIAFVLFLMLSVSSSVAFLVNAHRYISGEDSSIARLRWPVEWWAWDIPLPIVLIVTILSTFGYMFLVIQNVGLESSNTQEVDVQANYGRSTRT